MSTSVTNFLEELDIMLTKAKIEDNLVGDLKNPSKVKVLQLLEEKVSELELEGKEENFIALEEIKLFIQNNF